MDIGQDTIVLVWWVCFPERYPSAQRPHISSENAHILLSVEQAAKVCPDGSNLQAVISPYPLARSTNPYINQHTPCAPPNATIGASSPDVLCIVRIIAFFLCPSPDEATVKVMFLESSSSSSTRALFVKATPGPECGGDFRTDILSSVRGG